MKANAITFSLAAVLCLLAACSAWGKVIYVDDDAPTGGDGTSWATAYRFLQNALAEAEAAGEAVEVRVAQGTYKPDQQWPHLASSGGRRATFHLLDGLTLRGGFAGVGASDPNARDIEFYRTILSGDLAGNDSEVAGPLDMRGAASHEDNCYHVVSYNADLKSKGTITVELDGLVVRAGYAFIYESGNPFISTLPEECGGGLFIVGGGVESSQGVTLRECTFEENYAEAIGGGIWCSSCNLTLRECVLAGNGTQGYGGGLYVGKGGDIQVSDCGFERNQAGKGGGIYLDCSATLRDCLLSGNVAEHGGGLYQSAGTGFLEDCVLSRNVASHSGGGIFCTRTIESMRCRYVGNDALYGGGATWVILGPLLP